jgi:hypothetical protein
LIFNLSGHHGCAGLSCFIPSRKAHRFWFIHVSQVCFPRFCVLLIIITREWKIVKCFSLLQYDIHSLQHMYIWDIEFPMKYIVKTYCVMKWTYNKYWALWYTFIFSFLISKACGTKLSNIHFSEKPRITIRKLYKAIQNNIK